MYYSAIYISCRLDSGNRARRQAPTGLRASVPKKMVFLDSTAVSCGKQPSLVFCTYSYLSASQRFGAIFGTSRC